MFKRKTRTRRLPGAVVGADGGGMGVGKGSSRVQVQVSKRGKKKILDRLTVQVLPLLVLYWAWRLEF